MPTEGEAMKKIEFRLAKENELEEVYAVFAAAIETMKQNQIDQWDEFYLMEKKLVVE